VILSLVVFLATALQVITNLIPVINFGRRKVVWILGVLYILSKSNWFNFEWHFLFFLFSFSCFFFQNGGPHSSFNCLGHFKTCLWWWWWWWTIYLQHDAMLAWYMPLSCVCVCVCVCVCLSITLRYYIKMAKCRLTQIMLHDSPGTLVLWCWKSRRKLNEITPYRGAKRKWGMIESAIFDE